jgi:hypothetical protein
MGRLEDAKSVRMAAESMAPTLRGTVKVPSTSKRASVGFDIASVPVDLDAGALEEEITSQLRFWGVCNGNVGLCYIQGELKSLKFARTDRQTLYSCSCRATISE